jgi:predicted membrane-bound mannosyltransferase
MKVTGKAVPTSVGIFFIGFALLAAAFIFPGTKEAQSPILYVCIFGGLFVGIPAALGIGVVVENRRKRTPR